MGLFDVLKDGAGFVKESMEKRRERIMHYKEMLESRSDDELKRIFHNATGEKKLPQVFCSAKEATRLQMSKFLKEEISVEQVTKKPIICPCGRSLGQATNRTPPGTKVCPNCKKRVRYEFVNGKVHTSYVN